MLIDLKRLKTDIIIAVRDSLMGVA